MIFFTSDPHFDHANIIEYCNRPFDNAETMSETIVANWNKKASANDRIICLGDWCLCGRERSYTERSRFWREKINCNNIVFIYGNHDHKARGNSMFHRLFNGCYDVYEEYIGDQKIVCCHYAMRVWNKSHRGSWMLYGHSHGVLSDDPNSLSIDVGVDAYAMRKDKSPEFYTLFSMYEINDIMKAKTWKPPDKENL